MILSDLKMPTTRAEAVYTGLKQQITDAHLLPGQRLNIDELARQIGVSPSPVREALRRLESDGLVRNMPYVGVVVTQASPEELIGDYRILAVLSGLAAGLAVPHLTDADHATIERYIEGFDRYVHEGDLEKVDACNLGLHEVINAACGIARLRAQIHDLWQYSIQRHHLQFGRVPDRPKSANEEHRVILTALRGRDAAATESAMRAHLWHAADLFAKHFQENSLILPTEVEPGDEPALREMGKDGMGALQIEMRRT